MKTTTLLKSSLAGLLAVGAAAVLLAADPPAEPSKRPTPEEWKKLTPEQRQIKLKELRDKQLNMTAERRAAQIEAQRKVWRDRMEKQITELQAKKTAGTITPEEEKRIERLREMLKRWDEGAGPAKPATPTDKPAEKPTKPAESK